MRFSVAWLREWVEPGVSTEALCERLTLAGLEVGSVTPAAPEIEGVVVAEIDALRAHPALAHLQICEARVGGGRSLTVVSAAPGLRSGMRVPLALPGARLPGGRRIDTAAFGEVVSRGMLCSAAELGLGEGADRVWELPPELAAGADLNAILGHDDRCLELELTPNRGDCLGIEGIAREIGALYDRPVRGPAIEPVRPTGAEEFPIEVLAPEACPHYCGRVVRGIDAHARTPWWLRERLRRSGLRAIHPVVDITNYVMLELGQPMHAFDLARLEGAVVVRYASAGEAIALLDGQTLTLEEGTLVIADRSRAAALAGVMGGRDTAVAEDTDTVFLESAHFAPAALAGQARRYRLQTDSSHRFERGVDFNLPARALERATALLVSVCGGHPGPLTARRCTDRLPQRAPIRLRSRRIERLLGVPFDAAEVTGILSRLGLRVEELPEGDDGMHWRVTPPSFRFDLVIEADLIEELARIRGYESIPGTRPRATLQIRPRPEGEVGTTRIRQVLTDRGYQEAITYSFVDPGLQSHIEPAIEPVALANPIASDMAVMRTSLWPGLLQALRFNQHRQCTRVRLFETGLVFARRGVEIDQRPMIAGVLWGLCHPEQWAEPRRGVDFFDLKGDVEALLALLGPAPFEFGPCNHPALHPGQASAVLHRGHTVGLLGALHPERLPILALEGPVFAFQLDFEVYRRGSVPHFVPVSKFPSVRRDLSIVLDRRVAAAAVSACIHEAASEAPDALSLRDLQLFDLYLGEGIDQEKKSIAIGLTFQGLSSTLLDAEVDEAIGRIVARLAERLGAKLRGPA